MNKVKVTRYGSIHYYAQCTVCDFDAGMCADITHEKVRRLVRKHVLDTGHRVTLEAGTSTDYDLRG